MIISIKKLQIPKAGLPTHGLFVGNTCIGASADMAHLEQMKVIELARQTFDRWAAGVAFGLIVALVIVNLSI